MKNFFVRTGGLWRCLAVIFTFVFVIGFTAGNLLELNSSQVNRYLGTTTTAVVGGNYDVYTPDYASSDGLLEAHVAAGTRAGAEGSVLLKNNGVLPLDASGDRITLFGFASAVSGAYGMNFGMTVGGEVDASQNVSLYDALTDRGADVNREMSEYYNSSIPKKNVLSVSLTTIDKAPQYSPVEVLPDLSLMGAYRGGTGIVVIGRPSTEGGDYYPGDVGLSEKTVGRSALAVTRDELDLIDTVRGQCGKVIVLINACNPMELREIMEGGAHEADAILWIGLPGNYGLYGVADILLGNVSPSGHLADTYAYDSSSSPAMQNFGLYRFSNADGMEKEDRGQYYLVEAENIYTGYKYYETRYEDTVLGQGNASSDEGAFDSESGWVYGEEVAYPFGYGLSYTTFGQEITGVTFSGDMRTARISVSVENTGETPGKSVVQVYGQSPYTDYDRENGVEKASVQLLGYCKTDTLAPGETAQCTVETDMQLLASYDSACAGTYIMEADENYYFALGCNSSGEGAHAAVNNILALKGKTPADGMDADGDAAAAERFAWDENHTDIFSVSEAGVEVVNRLDAMDLNNLDSGTRVTYLSRDDWTWGGLWNTGKWETVSSRGYTGVSAGPEMRRVLANGLYETQTGDTSGVLFGQDCGVTFADTVGEDGTPAAYDDPVWDALLDGLDLEEAIQFIINGNSEYLPLSSVGFAGGQFTENGPTGLQMKIPGSYDAPWFRQDDPNRNYSWNDMGAAPLQASAFDPSFMEEIGRMWGNDSLYVNLPMLWAPALNLHRTPYNGRTAEYYSEDPVLTGTSAAAVSRGAAEKGLIVTLKHFAFNDQESNRCGMAVFQNEQKARENELRGFQIAIEGGAKAVMTSFNRVGCMFSGADAGLMGVLRGEWAFRGYAVTDLIYSYDYVTFADAVMAGSSAFDSTYEKAVGSWGTAAGLAAEYSGDPYMLSAIKEAVHATLWTFAHTNAMNYAGGEGTWVANWWRVTYITAEAVGGALGIAALVLCAVSAALRREKKVKDTEGDGDENHSETGNG